MDNESGDTYHYETPAEAIRSIVKRSHLRSASDPVNTADSAGAFRESTLAVLCGEALPVVLDANTLRNDIARACRQGHRTVLTSAANEGSFRLYCASHVVNEVEKYGQRWAAECKIDFALYKQCWDEYYVPLIRLVDTTELFTLLSLEEQRRVSELTDQDDAPSAILALVIQAVYLSEDRRPHFTVYNFETTRDERRAWLEPLMAASDHAQLSLYVHGTLLAPIAGIAGLVEIGKRLQRALPAAPYILFGAAAVAGAWIARNNSAAILDNLKRFGQFYCDGMIGPSVESHAAYQRLIPAIPSWHDLSEKKSRTQVLTRAVMHTMARSRVDLPTPRTVSDILVGIPVDTSPARVGKVLHSANFVTTYRGCFQLGACSGD